MKTMIWAMIALAATVGTAVAYTKARPQPQAVAQDRSQDADWLNSQQLALAKLKPADGWKTLPNGLRWRRVKGDGSGRHPTLADQVTIHYSGALADGAEFDSSRGGPPATFPLGELVPAWQIAVPLMGVGDTIELGVPAELGYGAEGAGPIPGNATLFFKIELLGIGNS